MHSNKYKEPFFSLNITAPPAIFAKPPEIIEISYTEATVEVSNFEVENYGPHVTPQLYTIQYKVVILFLAAFI